MTSIYICTTGKPDINRLNDFQALHGLTLVGQPLSAGTGGGTVTERGMYEGRSFGVRARVNRR